MWIKSSKESLNFENKILGYRDPRYKHEYLDRVQCWETITEGNGDESDTYRRS